MSARTDVAAFLTAALPTWRVEPTSDAGTITKSTALVYPAEVTPGPVQGTREVSLSVVVVAAGQVRQDGPLEALLEAALTALDACPLATWTRAVRSTYADTNPAYDITVEATETTEG